jgi:hypothetical protein
MEVNGQSALALIININHDQMKEILENHGLDQIDPEQWYPLQQILDVFNELSERAGAMFNFVAVGKAAGELGAENLPPEMAKLSLAEFLEVYGRVWVSRHRNAAPDSITTEKVDDRHIKVISKVPYPDDLVYGIMYAYPRYFLPEGAGFVVKYDENIPRRDQGGEETVIHITW